MYDISSLLIVSILFVLILLGYEIGFRIGKRYQKKSDDEIKLQTNAVQAGTLGLLGQKRSYVPTVLMTLLIVLVVFIIIDLDRPKRGIIKVKQDRKMELKQENANPELK